MIAGSQATVTLPDEGAPTTAPSLIAVSKVEKFRINHPPPANSASSVDIIQQNRVLFGIGVGVWRRKE